MHLGDLLGDVGLEAARGADRAELSLAVAKPVMPPKLSVKRECTISSGVVVLMPMRPVFSNTTELVRSTAFVNLPMEFAVPVLTLGELLRSAAERGRGQAVRPAGAQVHRVATLRVHGHDLCLVPEQSAAGLGVVERQGHGLGRRRERRVARWSAGAPAAPPPRGLRPTTAPRPPPTPSTARTSSPTRFVPCSPLVARACHAGHQASDVRGPNGSALAGPGLGPGWPRAIMSR